MRLHEGRTESGLTTQTARIMNKDRFSSVAECMDAWKRESKMLEDTFSCEDDIVLFSVWLYSDSTEDAFALWEQAMTVSDGIKNKAHEFHLYE